MSTVLDADKMERDPKQQAARSSRTGLWLALLANSLA
jgi:hypothetical protein